MRRLIFAALLLLILLPFVSADLLSDDIHLSRIRLGDNGYVSGRYMDTYVYVFNSNPDHTAWDGRVTMRFVDDSVYGTSGLFNVRSMNGVGQSMLTDIDGTAPGEYLVKITYTNNDIQKTKYRYVIVE
jgi:hypothetical protein